MDDHDDILNGCQTLEQKVRLDRFSDHTDLLANIYAAVHRKVDWAAGPETPQERALAIAFSAGMAATTFLQEQGLTPAEIDALNWRDVARGFVEGTAFPVE